MSSTDYPAVAILGPTGSGKSSLGLEMAERFEGEIISCDALQIYRGMDIGTAKPTPAERRRVSHHLLDLREPDEDFSAGDYQREARKALGEIGARARLPIVIGGTGFYFRALTDGLFEGPGRSDSLRDRMRAIVARKGPEPLFRMLKRTDPTSAARIPPADAARIIRACEVYLLTGRTMTWWQAQPRDTLHGFRWLKLGVAWARDSLYRRIDDRVTEMYRQGFVEEVRQLVAESARGCQAFKAIGYRQISEHLDGRTTLQQALEETQRESRRYAKRQLTWFRRDPDLIWLNGSDHTLEARAAVLIRNFLASGQ
jgi:tRNA dimethylallyltransferase